MNDDRAVFVFPLSNGDQARVVVELEPHGRFVFKLDGAAQTLVTSSYPRPALALAALGGLLVPWLNGTGESSTIVVTDGVPIGGPIGEA